MSSEDRIHVEIFSQIAALAARVKHIEHESRCTTIINIFIGGNMDVSRLNDAVAKNKTVGDVLDSIFDAIAQAIRDAKGNQSQLDALATQLESDNAREDLRVNALKDLVTPETPALAAAWNGPTAGSVGSTFSGAVAASGGKSPYSYTQDQGALPDGCTFAADGSVSGTLGAAGEFSFGGSVTDSAGASAQWSGTVSVS